MWQDWGTQWWSPPPPGWQDSWASKEFGAQQQGRGWTSWWQLPAEEAAAEAPALAEPPVTAEPPAAPAAPAAPAKDETQMRKLAGGAIDKIIQDAAQKGETLSQDVYNILRDQPTEVIVLVASRKELVRRGESSRPGENLANARMCLRIKEARIHLGLPANKGKGKGKIDSELHQAINAMMSFAREYAPEPQNRLQIAITAQSNQALKGKGKGKTKDKTKDKGKPPPPDALG